jgi:hypothetical protein
MARKRPIPVKLSQETICRLDRAAQSVLINRSDVIRMCIGAFLRDFEARGRSSIPTDWQTLIYSEVSGNHNRVSLVAEPHARYAVRERKRGKAK